MDNETNQKFTEQKCLEIQDDNLENISGVKSNCVSDSEDSSLSTELTDQNKPNEASSHEPASDSDDNQNDVANQNDNNEVSSDTDNSGNYYSAIHHFEKLLKSGFDKILHSFEQKLAYDITKQQQIDSLHSELQKYRTDLIAKTNRPIINGLIRLHDDIGRLVEKLKSCPPEQLNHNRFFKVIDGIQEDIEILLDQNGIITFRESFEEFSPRRQQAIKSIPINEEDLNGVVAARIRPGFEIGNEIIKKERVTVYVFNKSAGKEDRPDHSHEHQISTMPESVPQSTEEENNV
ncbi:MAG: nucleotide exchange factor GrpE [Deltaproteobacteria bacterium]|nr:nucleotide exchange factor GrpE [Deltaproteobacteria bacterium]